MNEGLIVLCVILLLANAWSLGGRLERRVKRLEARLDAIAEHLGIAKPPPLAPEVEDLVRAGRKIEAIKAYRQGTGAGLAEAKDEVERIAAGLPDSPIAAPGGPTQA